MLLGQSVDRCYTLDEALSTLDEALSRLAREYPQIKFLRSRAAALGFASVQPTAPTSGRRVGKLISTRDDDDEEDPYADDFDNDGAIPPFLYIKKANTFVFIDKADYPEYDEDSVDTDVLPTMLV